LDREFIVEEELCVVGRVRRSVRFVRIGVMDPEEELPALKGFQPWKGPLVDLFGRKVPALRWELIGVFLESFIEAELRRQDSQADESGRLEPFLSEEVDKGWVRHCFRKTWPLL